jgi:hypothetical protein
MTGREQRGQRDRGYPPQEYREAPSWSPSPPQESRSSAGRPAYTDNWREQGASPTNGIPLVDRRAPPPAQRRDADGQFGEQMSGQVPRDALCGRDF